MKPSKYGLIAAALCGVIGLLAAAFGSFSLSWAAAAYVASFLTILLIMEYDT